MLWKIINNFDIVETIFVTISYIFLVLWIFRPNSKHSYDEYSMIPFHQKDEL